MYRVAGCVRDSCPRCVYDGIRLTLSCAITQFTTRNRSSLSANLSITRHTRVSPRVSITTNAEDELARNASSWHSSGTFRARNNHLGEGKDPGDEGHESLSFSPTKMHYIRRCAAGRCTTTAFDRDTQPFLREETRSYAMRVN